MSRTAPVRRWDVASWLPWLVAGLAVLILAAFAGLVPMSSWRGDEYHDFGLFRSQGWSFFFQRLLTWSPRPLSEAMAGLYFLAEEGTGRQLIASFLALLWLTLLIGPALYLWRRPSRSRVVLVTAVPCLFMLGHDVAEVFYWPMGAVAYVPTLAAMAALTLHVIDGRWDRRHGRVLCISVLLCAAASSEVGAIFAICFAGATFGLHLLGRAGERRDAAVWLLPFALGVLVMVALSLGRGRLDENVAYHGLQPDPTLLRHPIASLAGAVPIYLREIFALNGLEAGPGAILFGAVVKAVAALGFLALLRSEPAVDDARGSQQMRAALVASLQATVFLSIAGSYYKFGLVCCERHDTMRQCMGVLTLLCGAALLREAGARVFRSVQGVTVGAGLLGTVLVALSGRDFGSVEAAYAARAEAVAVRNANWDAGHAADDRMVFRIAPMPPVVGGLLPPQGGTFRLDERPPWLWELVMTFFNKREIELKPLD